ncbi:MAG: hypothetical protein ACUZ77_07965 [Candidatus Brocadiales bacterium]
MGKIGKIYHPIYGPVVEIEVKSPYKEPFQKSVKLTAEVDSAANVTAIHDAVARNLQLPSVGIREIDTAGGKMKFTCYSCLIRVNGFAAEIGSVIVGLENIEKEYVLLGRDVINSFIVVLDGPQQTLTITAPYSP